MKKTLGLLLGILVAGLISLLASENPFHVFSIIFKSSLGSLYDIGWTVSYMTPLIFSGLAAAVCFRAGLFNIGAEGQLTFSCLAMTLWGVRNPLELGVFGSVISILIVGILAGGLAGAFAGWIKAYRGGHEVITTMMLNFISLGIMNYVITQVIPNPDSQNPESAFIQKNFMISSDPIKAIFPDTPANFSFIVALLTVAFAYYLLNKSRFGYVIDAVGSNENAAERSGINVKRIQLLVFILGGAFASLVGLSEVVGSAHQLRLGFSAEYGFLGIAVALLADNQPVKIIFSAFLIALLHKGASELDLETSHLTRDFSYILQALIILGVIYKPRLEGLLSKFKSKTGAAQ